MRRGTIRFKFILTGTLVLVFMAACRELPEAIQPEAVVTVLSATLEPASTAVPPIAATDVPTLEATATIQATEQPDPTITPEQGSTPFALLPGVSAYNLGETILVQERFPEDSRFRNMPARLEGIIAVPDALERPAPVVLILHGNHRGCPINPDNTDVDLWPCTIEQEQQNYQGFDYLVRTLADQGYIALAININGEYTIGFGEPTFGERGLQLIRDHLGALATATAGGANNFGVELAGQVDLGRLAILGHSQGGELANRLTREQGWDSSYSMSDNGFGPVDGLLHLAPAFNILGSDGGSVPMAAILPECDGDVGQLHGQFYYEALRHDPDFETWSTTALVSGANHNFFNRMLSAENLAPVACPTPLTAAEQQAFLVDYASTFLQAIWSAQPDQLGALATLGLDVTQPVAQSIAGVEVRTVSHVPENFPLLIPTDESELEASLSSGQLRLENVTTLFCRAGFDRELEMSLLEACRRPNYNQPGQPAQLLAHWNNPDGAIRFVLPEEHRDVSRFTALSLRAVLDPLSKLNEPGQPQSFSIELVDGNGQVARVVVASDDPALQFPPGEVEPSEFFVDGILSGNVHMSDIRVPLGEFEGVDLTSLEEVNLSFDQTESGSLFLADVQFVRPSAAIGAYSTLLENADGTNDALRAIGRLSGSSVCTATFFDTGDSADSAAYAITNGHCAQPWEANEVFEGLPGDGFTITFNYFTDTVDQQIIVPISQVAYSTMKGRDVAIVELDTTIGQLASEGINPLPLATEPADFPFEMRVVGAPVSGVPAELAYLREEYCQATASVALLEFIWHFDDAIRNSCLDIYGGSSGSPVFAGDDNSILALINTSTVGGSTPCAAGAPCEVDGSGTALVSNTSYTTPILGIDACFTDGAFELESADCPLDNGEQLTLSGYPSQPIQPTTTGPDGQSVAATWNTILSGDRPYYRFKHGPAGLTDCRVEAGYGDVIPLSSHQVIDDPLPADEGSYLLCVVAGPTPVVDSTWQPIKWATVARAEIDTTSPVRPPHINILYLGDMVSIEPIFDLPELVDYRVKIGPVEGTNCDSDDDYVRYRRIPFQVGSDELPVKVCVIGSDSAGNEGAPVEHIIRPR